MENRKINDKLTDSQWSDMGLNLVGPTVDYLDSDFLRDNSRFAKEFERLNTGAE